MSKMKDTTKQQFPVLYAGEFVRKADRVISIIKNIDLSKYVSSQLMAAAACVEVAEFNECLRATQESERKIYTGSLLQCTPTLETYIKHFKEAKKSLDNPYYPEAVCLYIKENDPILYSEPTLSQIQKNYEKALSKDLITLNFIKNHDSVTYLQFEEDELYRDHVIINDEYCDVTPAKEGTPRDFNTLIDSWATGVKTGMSEDIFILLKQLDDTITEISNLNYIVNNPRAEALANGLEQMFSSYLVHYWIEEQAKIELKIELLMREYDEEDTEGITNALFYFYEELRMEKRPFPQDVGFVNLWHKHLSKDNKPEKYLSLAQEMLLDWNKYKRFFKGGVLGRCFQEIQMDEYISYELRDLRKAQKHKAKESKGQLTDVLDTELAREIFAECIENGWMHETENGYQWDGIPNCRGRVAPLAYLCGKVYGFKYSDKEGRNIGKEFPDPELCKLFNIVDLGKQLVQVYQAKNKQKWRAVIDKLFK